MKEEQIIGTLSDFVEQSAERIRGAKEKEEGGDLALLGVTTHKDVVFLSMSRGSAFHLATHIDAEGCAFAKQVADVLFQEGIR